MDSIEFAKASGLEPEDLVGLETKDLAMLDPVEWGEYKRKFTPCEDFPTFKHLMKQYAVVMRKIFSIQPLAQVMRSLLANF
ncbi:hypothetical protein [Microcoleus sp. B7-D4]|uniref:hypothetical protein n=1 Tax=Microcoleus sp. B7-D4 TaxID=2818696 RepID=UPI002FD2C42E